MLAGKIFFQINFEKGKKNYYSMNQFEKAFAPPIHNLMV